MSQLSLYLYAYITQTSADTFWTCRLSSLSCCCCSSPEAECKLPSVNLGALSTCSALTSADTSLNTPSWIW